MDGFSTLLSEWDSPKKLFDFMNAVEKFYSEENPGDESTGVEMTIEGIRIFITKESGIKVFCLAEKNGPGYRIQNHGLYCPTPTALN